MVKSTSILGPLASEAVWPDKRCVRECRSTLGFSLGGLKA